MINVAAAARSDDEHESDETAGRLLSDRPGVMSGDVANYHTRRDADKWLESRSLCSGIRSVAA